MSSKEAILRNLKSRSVLTVSGNQDLAEAASDIINSLGMTDKTLSVKCDLSIGTVKRVRLLNRPYRPNALTIERSSKRSTYTST